VVAGNLMAELGPACLLRPNSPSFERILFFSIYFFQFGKYIIASKFSKTKLPPPCPMAPWATAVAGATMSNRRQPPWPMAVRFNMFSKNRNSFVRTTNSDGDQLYTKLLASTRSTTLRLNFFSFEVILRLKQMIYCLDLDTDN
jgi:hypothetical protein